MFGIMVSDMIRRVIGIILLLVIGFLASTDKKKIDWMHIAIKFAMICIGAFLFLKVSFAQNIIAFLATFFMSLYEIANIGIGFVFGSLADYCGPCGFVFAVKVLPVIVFFSSLVSVLYFYGIIQFIVGFLGKFLQPIFGTNGAETLNAVANSFLGQTEAPLLVRGYLKNMNESEVFAIMVSGMGTISCGLFAVYQSYGISAEHLLISSILSIPATLLIAKLWHPNSSTKREKAHADYKSPHASVLDALSIGAIDGISLALNVGAIVLVFTSFLFMVNNFIAWISSFFVSCENILSLNTLFGYVMMPFAWVLGIIEPDIMPAAGLIALKTVVNEMFAYIQLANMCLDPKTVLMLTYALCGFANFSSIGIQVGSLGTMEPSMRATLSKLGIKAVLAALCSNMLIACTVGLFI